MTIKTRSISKYKNCK
uniref:Uncharacterized protein n=1 Tax=Rhizophora mucronata TaxID=61149 RepID=A0A2P2NNL0_RHIMU